ncbi:MAG: DUF4907 domain-containing protein [Flavobacteriales bacterium]|nr:DUF4907 domain-containing protein [Flavobacteriales bacterium]
MERSTLIAFILFVSHGSSAQLAQPRNAEGLPIPAPTVGAETPKTPTTATITHRIIDAPNETYGYEILANGKLLIRQTNVPGQPGNNGCATIADAEKLAALVAGKVQRGEMPPTVTRKELQQLSIIR